MTTTLEKASVTARMSKWMLIEADDDECLFGFADEHPVTMGLSWVISTPVVEMNEPATRALTASGRVYALGREISYRELDEEGRTALRLLVTDRLEDYPGRAYDVAWLITQKMARHLKLPPPLRSDMDAVEEFCRQHLRSYLELRESVHRRQ